MKKVLSRLRFSLSGLALGCVLAVGGVNVLLSYPAAAIEICIGSDCETVSDIPHGEFELPDEDLFNSIGENTSLRDYILDVLNFFLSFLGLVAVAGVIYAGYLAVASGGDDGQLEKAKKIVIWAVIGIVIVLSSYAIVNTVIQEAPTGGDDRPEEEA